MNMKNGLEPYQDFVWQLREAFNASKNVDNFDLHSEDVDNKATWDELLKMQASEFETLIALVLEHHEMIRATIPHL